MSSQRKLKYFSLRCVAGMCFLLVSALSVQAQVDPTKVAKPPVEAPAAAATGKPGAAPPAKAGFSVPGHPGMTIPHFPGTKPAANQAPHPTVPQQATRVNPTQPQRPGGNPPQQTMATKPQPAMPKVQTQVKTDRNGNQQVIRNGRVSDIKMAGTNANIHRNIAGGQRVSMRRPDGSLLYAERGRPSYIEHSYQFRGQNYGRRSYYYNGRVYDRYYRPYNYRGVIVESYAPPYYYSPYYYGWAYNPWGSIQYSAWGWSGQPWYGYYGNYFSPAPVYPTASLWLTDYLISQSLAASYGARSADASTANLTPSAPAAALTPEVKEQISKEVQQEVALENEEAQKSAKNSDIDPAMSGIGRTLADGAQHVFLAGRSIDVVDATGLECAVTEGDVLKLSAPLPPGAATSADLVVLASKGDPDCHPGSTVAVAFDEIQEMQNHMRETLDQGLTTLHDQAGKNGIPALPPSAQPAPVKTAFAAQAPPPDPSTSADIDHELKEADKAAKEIPQSSGLVAGNPVSTTQTQEDSITGWTMQQVAGKYGRATAVQDRGSKKVWVYADMKVIFVNGKVVDIE